MRNRTLFHVLQEHNISLYASVDTDVVLAKKRGRGVFITLRPFPVGRYRILFDLQNRPQEYAPLDVDFLLLFMLS